MAFRPTLFSGRLSGLEENLESIWLNERSPLKSHGTVTTPAEDSYLLTRCPGVKSLLIKRKAAITDGIKVLGYQQTDLSTNDQSGKSGKREKMVYFFREYLKTETDPGFLAEESTGSLRDNLTARLNKQTITGKTIYDTRSQESDYPWERK